MPEPKRDRWGRYILTDPETGEERPWTRATTLAGALDDTYGLTQWKMRSVVLGLCERSDLLDLAYASDADDKKQLDEICEDALKAAEANKKSHQGTALHRFTERLDRGELSRSPRQWDGHLRAYRTLTKAEGITVPPKSIERITVVPSMGVAGTMDRIARHQGKLKILDLKTGNIKWDGMKISIQLALYAHGVGLWDATNATWDGMPPVDQREALVVHLPATLADGEKPHAELYSVDIALGWEMAQAAYQAREWRKRKDLLVPVRGIEQS